MVELQHDFHHWGLPITRIPRDVRAIPREVFPSVYAYSSNRLRVDVRSPHLSRVVQKKAGDAIGWRHWLNTSKIASKILNPNCSAFVFVDCLVHPLSMSKTTLVSFLSAAALVRHRSHRQKDTCTIGLNKSTRNIAKIAILINMIPVANLTMARYFIGSRKLLGRCWTSTSMESHCIKSSRRKMLSAFPKPLRSALL